MAETRRKFDADFKEGAVRLVRETGKPIAQVARDLGINAGTLGNWVNADRRLREGGDGRLGEDERAELARLRKENAELAMEVRCAQTLGGPLGQGRDGAVAVAGLIAAQRDEHGIPAAVSCRALGVSRSWFYKWKDGDRSPPAGAPGAAEGRGQAAVRRAPGQVRVAADHRGPAGGGLDGQQEHRRGADARAWAWPPGGRSSRKGARPGRARAGGGRRTWSSGTSRRRRSTSKWYGDGTEICTGEGKLYLASVLDVASRRVLGFALGEHHDAELAYGALAMAVAVRGGQVPGVIMHTDYAEDGVKPRNHGLAWSAVAC